MTVNHTFIMSACILSIAVAATVATAGENDAAPSVEVQSAAVPSDRVSQAAEAQEKSADVPDSLRWEPWWRECGDCGPLALLVLMQLQNKRVTLAEIKNLVRVDPEDGCSLKDLQAAAEKLGMPAEARFVEPHDLCNVPGPFIVHGLWSVEKNRGHFYLVFGYDAEKKKYVTIDTTLAKLGRIPEDTILRGYSGYVLVPKNPLSCKWNYLAGCGLLFIGGVTLSAWSYSMFRRRQSGDT